MKKNIISFILGALIFGSIGVYAAGGNLIEVFYNVEGIVIDGVAKTSEQKPFIYNGSTYVPLRFISESMGKEVMWDDATRTVHIGKVEKDRIAYPGYNIDSITIQDDRPWVNIEYKYKDKQIKDNLGKAYDSYILFTGTQINSSGYIEFPTNGEYRKLKGTLGITETYKDTKLTMKFKIYADDKEVYSKSINAGDFPEEIDIDISNAIKVKMEVNLKDNTNFGSCEFALFNSTFEK